MIDLSYIDIHGNRTGAQETANSYIIREPGNYCLPLVYGCGIKNGKNNKAGYTAYGIPEGKEPPSEPGRGYFPYEFLDYKNKPIQGPEIKKQILGAKIISFDNSREIIKNLRIKSGYLEFSVLEIPEGGANYTLGALDKSSRVIWSWHIWLWKDELKDIEVMGSIKLLSENLGTFKTRSGQKYSWLYQWGRKDPLFPAYGHKKQKIKEEIYTIGEAIQNPDILVGDRMLNFWTDDSKIQYIVPGMYCNLWNSKYWEQKIVKTIYDPCPPGYHVPEENAFKFACPEGYLGFSHYPPEQRFPTVLDYNENNIFTFSRYPGDYTGIELLMEKVRNFMTPEQSIYYTGAKTTYGYNTVKAFEFCYDGGQGYLGTTSIPGNIAAYIKPQRD